MIPWFTNFAIYLNKQAVFSMQKPLALIDSFVFVRCNLFQWSGSQFVLVVQRIRISNRKMWLLWRAIGYFFLDYVSHHRFSIVIHNTVILVAMPDSWAIHSRNTGHDLKKYFPRWGNLHYVMKVDDDDDVLFLLSTWPIPVSCIRFVARIHATQPPVLNVEICYFSGEHSTLTALGLIFCYNVDSER